MKQYNPSFILWTGDVIAGKDAKNSSLINSEYQAFFKLAKTAGVPVCNAPGNHEMNAAGNAPCATMGLIDNFRLTSRVISEGGRAYTGRPFRNCEVYCAEE